MEIYFTQSIGIIKKSYHNTYTIIMDNEGMRLFKNIIIGIIIEEREPRHSCCIHEPNWSHLRHFLVI